MAIKIKEKPCKGTGKAKGFGCGEMRLARTYGLGNLCCYRNWLFNTEEGKKKMTKTILKATEGSRSLKEAEKKKNVPKRKQDLQKEINILSRKIDSHFNYKCVDCGNPFGKKTDAAHLHNVSGNENIRYNLHNLHSARSHCNRFSSEHKVGYRKGILERYNRTYLNYIDFEIPLKYKYLGLLDSEVEEKLKIVRKINRTFDTYQLKDGIQARNLFNKIIGIYK